MQPGEAVSISDTRGSSAKEERHKVYQLPFLRNIGLFEMVFFMETKDPGGKAVRKAVAVKEAGEVEAAEEGEAEAEAVEAVVGTHQRCYYLTSSCEWW
jgi:hypothetical protein